MTSYMIHTCVQITSTSFSLKKHKEAEEIISGCMVFNSVSNNKKGYNNNRHQVIDYEN